MGQTNLERDTFRVTFVNDCELSAQGIEAVF